MSAPGLRVPRARGEEARRALLERGLLDGTREIQSEGDHLILPLTARDPQASEWGDLVDRDFRRLPRGGPSDYRELVDLAGPLRAQLPRSFDVIGDVVLIRLPTELEEHREAIGRALIAFVPGARIVGVDRGVRGTERRREIERIAGAGPWSTRHRENGLSIEVDVERAYFSPRLAREHERVADEVTEGDRVYDLCCGVGPFTLTIARSGRARAVTAVDSNPAAIELLRASLRRSSFRVPVEPAEGRIEEFLPSAKPRERVVFNLPLEGIKYLPSVGRAVVPGGRLYYYEVAERSRLAERQEAIVTALGSSGSWSVRECHPVHPYSPSSDLYGFVVERGAA